MRQQRGSAQRVEAERQLQASERLFRALAEHSSELVSVIGAGGDITYANPAWAGLLGYTPEEARGLTALDIVHPDDLPAVAEALGRTPPASRFSPDMSKHAYWGTDERIKAHYQQYAERL